MSEPGNTPGDVWFVYDGECPLCRLGARYMRISKAAGTLHLLDARTQSDHPILRQIKARRLHLDKGMVVRAGNNFYHGADALNALALMATGSDWVNRLNARLFRSRRLAGICYPFLRAGRRLALWAKGVPPL